MSFVTDTFSGTAGTLLQNHTSDSGATWSKPAGLAASAILGGPTAPGEVYIASAVNINMLVYAASATPPFADYLVQADLVVHTIPTGSAEILGGVAARIDAGGACYVFWYEPNQELWAITYVQDYATAVDLATASALVLPGQTYTLGLRCEGSTLSGLVDNTPVCQITDTTLGAAGKAGLIFYNVATETTGSHLAAFSATTGGTLTVSPTTATAGSAQPLSLLGTGTAWTPGTPGAPTFSVAGGTGASLSGQSISAVGSASVVLHPGTSVGTLTITDPSTAATDTVSVGAGLSVSPPDAIVGQSEALTVLGAGTTWTPGTPGSPTFTLAGGTGAALSGQHISAATAASVQLAPGSARGTLVLTDPSTGKTVPIAVGANIVATEIATAAQTGATLYALLRNAAGQVWNTSTQLFETYTSGHFAQYALALAEQGTTGFYAAAFPGAITTAGRYLVDVRKQSSSAPLPKDQALAGGTLWWNGTGEVFVDADADGKVGVNGYAAGADPASWVLRAPANKLLTTSSGQVQHDMTQAVPVSNTAQTVGDALNAARAQGFGAWRLVGSTLTLYAADGTTAVHSFTLDSSTNPTTRA